LQWPTNTEPNTQASLTGKVISSW